MSAKNLKTLIDQAESYCTDHGHRFTDSRRDVLKIVANADSALSAYEILERLKQYHKNPKPPTAYRAIEFLQEHGFIHRIESLNAYTLCSAGHLHKGSQYMICGICGVVTEIHLCTIPESLGAKAKKNGFKLNFWNAELHGVCKKCC